MVSHRRARTSVRTVMTFTATGAAAATGVGLTATAGHAASVADVQTQVKALNLQAESATNDYDAAMEQLATLQKQVDTIQSQATSTQQSMNALLATLGPQAAAQYRSGSVDPELMLMLSAHPDQYLSQVSAMNQAAANEAMTLKSLKAEKAQLAALKAQATDQLAALRQAETQAAAKKTQILDKYRQAQALLATLTLAQQQAVVPTSTAWGG